MIRFNQMLVVGAISLLFLAGCNSAEQADTPQTSPVASFTAPMEAAQPTASVEGESGLLSVVSNTKGAVETGDFALAQEEFGKFEDVWSKVEDGIKAKSPDGYNTIEENMDAVMGALKESQPNKQKALAALQSLEQNINSVAKS